MDGLSMISDFRVDEKKNPVVWMDKDYDVSFDPNRFHFDVTHPI